MCVCVCECVCVHMFLKTGQLKAADIKSLHSFSPLVSIWQWKCLTCSRPSSTSMPQVRPYIVFSLSYHVCKVVFISPPPVMTSLGGSTNQIQCRLAPLIPAIQVTPLSLRPHPTHFMIWVFIPHILIPSHPHILIPSHPHITHSSFRPRLSILSFCLAALEKKL